VELLYQPESLLLEYEERCARQDSQTGKWLAGSGSHDLDRPTAPVNPMARMGNLLAVCRNRSPENARPSMTTTTQAVDAQLTLKTKRASSDPDRAFRCLVMWANTCAFDKDRARKKARTSSGTCDAMHATRSRSSSGYKNPSVDFFSVLREVRESLRTCCEGTVPVACISRVTGQDVTNAPAVCAPCRRRPVRSLTTQPVSRLETPVSAELAFLVAEELSARRSSQQVKSGR